MFVLCGYSLAWERSPFSRKFLAFYQAHLCMGADDGNGKMTQNTWERLKRSKNTVKRRRQHEVVSHCLIMLRLKFNIFSLVFFWWLPIVNLFIKHPGKGRRPEAFKHYSDFAQVKTHLKNLSRSYSILAEWGFPSISHQWASALSNLSTLCQSHYILHHHFTSPSA